jgi:hypothetical protein
MRGILAVGVLVASAATTPARAGESFACPSPPRSLGEQEKLARRLFQEGTAREAGDPRGALDRYACARSLVDRPAIELRMGLVAERMQLLDDAIRGFERYLELAGAAAPDANSIRVRIAELRAKRDAQASRVTPESPPVESNVTPESSRVEPSPPPAQSTSHDAPSSQGALPIVGWALVGTGAVLAIAGGALLVDSKSISDSVQSQPQGTPWASDAARGSYDSARTLQTAGIVCLALAPVALIGGIVLLTRPRSRTTSGARQVPRLVWAF